VAALGPPLFVQPEAFLRQVNNFTRCLLQCLWATQVAYTTEFVNRIVESIEKYEYDDLADNLALKHRDTLVNGEKQALLDFLDAIRFSTVSLSEWHLQLQITSKALSSVTIASRLSIPNTKRWCNLVYPLCLLLLLLLLTYRSEAGSGCFLRSSEHAVIRLAM